jgi:hypothetical protein
MGLEAFHGNVLSEATEESLNLTGIGRFLALTRNDEANSLACKHMEDEFSSSEVYQLQPKESIRTDDQPSRFQLGRILFDTSATYDRLAELLEHGATMKQTTLTEQFTFEDYRAQYSDDFLLLMTIRDGVATVSADDNAIEPEPGTTILSLAKENNRELETASQVSSVSDTSDTFPPDHQA